MEHEPQVVKDATCPSLSAQSTITFEIGTDQTGILLRVARNSGTGIFSSEWVPLHAVLDLLNKQQGPFTWEALLPLFPNRSVNTACFLMAVLLAEGLVQPSKVKPRRYELADPKAFMAKLMAPKKKTKSKKGGSKPPPVEVIPPADTVIDPPADPIEATA